MQKEILVHNSFLANRDKVRYLNINEVNALTNKDILPKQ